MADRVQVQKLVLLKMLAGCALRPVNNVSLVVFPSFPPLISVLYVTSSLPTSSTLLGAQGSDGKPACASSRCFWCYDGFDVMPPSPPKIFDSSGKAPEFSFTASHDAQGNRLALDISGSSAAGTGSSNSKAKDDGPPALRDPDAVATLVAEIRSIKDLLGVLVAEKRLAAAPVPPCDYAPPSHEKGSLAATPLYRFYDDADILELARRACPSDEAMAYFRESFISEFTKMNEWSEEGPANRPATHDGPTVFSCKGPADSVLRVHREVVPKWRPRWLERRRAPLTPKSLKSEDAVQLVEADWPVANVAQGVKVDGKICIKWNFRQEDFKISWTVLYLYYEDGGIMECDRFSHILLRNEVNNRLRGAVTKPLEQLSHVSHYT